MPTSIGKVLDNPIYTGTFIYNKVTTELVNDRRLIEANPESEFVRIENFCERLISDELEEKVQRIRAARRAIAKAKKKGPAGQDRGVRIPGMVLKYPLTGLVRCGCCGASLRPGSSKKGKPGLVKAYYYCPNRYSGSCVNHCYVPMDWLWTAVIGVIKKHLFPAPVTPSHDVPAWFAEVVDEVRAEMKAIHQADQDAVPDFQRQQRELGSKITGWSQSLGQPDLAMNVRQMLGDQLGQAIKQRDELTTLMEAAARQSTVVDALVDPQVVLDSLRRLDELLGSANPTLVNHELSLHLDTIEVFADYRVVVRTCKTGIARRSHRHAGNERRLP